MASQSFTGGFDFENRHVQQELVGNTFINSASVLLAAGPPFLDGWGTGSGGFTITPATQGGLDGPNSLAQVIGIPVFPIGVIENANLSQGRQLQRLFEVGSKRSYFVVGRTVSSLTIARTLFHGPSLMKALYAFASKRRFGENKVHWNEILRNADLLAETKSEDELEVVNIPGYGDFMSNLDSDLFDTPFGLMFYMAAGSGAPYGAFYLEECHINAHQMNINASSSLIAEGVTIQFDQLIPLDIGAVPLNATGLSPEGKGVSV